MKTRLSTSLFAFASLLVASHSSLAAAPKTDGRANSLVAAIQAVSPDPLGGRLGLDITSVRDAGVTSPNTSRLLAMKAPRAEADQKAYIVWKNSQKS